MIGPRIVFQLMDKFKLGGPSSPLSRIKDSFENESIVHFKDNSGVNLCMFSFSTLADWTALLTSFLLFLYKDMI